MSIDTTKTLRHIKKKLGASHHNIELLDNHIMETVFQETLPIFSRYFPYFNRIVVTPSIDHVDGRAGIYYLKTPLDILGISRVLVGNIVTHLTSISNFYSNPVDRQFLADLEGLVINPFTFKWWPPDKLEVFPKSLSYLEPFLVEVKCVHPKHLQTIPDTMREEFFKLAVYDVRDGLYQIRKRFSTLNTAFGNIELNMQDLEEAESKREELLEKWKTNFIKSANRQKIFIY